MNRSDKRRDERRAVSIQCEIDGMSDKTGMRISDLSMSGCYVDTRLTHVPVGRTVTLRLSAGGYPIEVTGRVAYIHMGMGFGVEFGELPDDVRTYLATLLRRA